MTDAPLTLPGRLASGRTVDVRVTEHAIDRYRLRVRDAERERAVEELAQLLDLCCIREGSPAWTPGRQRPLFHLDVAGTIMVAMDPDPRDPTRLVARTVLTTGAFSRRRGARLASGRTPSSEAADR